MKYQQEVHSLLDLENKQRKKIRLYKIILSNIIRALIHSSRFGIGQEMKENILFKMLILCLLNHKREPSGRATFVQIRGSMLHLQPVRRGGLWCARMRTNFRVRKWQNLIHNANNQLLKQSLLYNSL